MEGQGVGGMLRLFRKRLPRLRAGLDWVAHFPFSTVTLFHGAVSSLKCFFFFFLLYLHRHLGPHVIGLQGFLSWFLEPVSPPAGGIGVVTASHMAMDLF